nr:MAG TPA: hypothetical protein [Bacteriophage sp.]
MSAATNIAAKLREYEHTGSYVGAVEDIYALIHHIAALEEEIDDLKEATVPRTVESDGSDLPFGSVVIDCDGDAWQRDWADGWSLAGESSENTPVLSPEFAPYTIVHTPKEEP